MATFLTEATISYPPTRLLSGRDAIGRESWSGLPQHCPVCCHKTFVVKDLLRRCANCDHILPMEFDEKLKAPPRPSARAIRMFTKTPAEDPDLPHLLPPPRLYRKQEAAAAMPTEPLPEPPRRLHTAPAGSQRAFPAADVAPYDDPFKSFSFPPPPQMPDTTTESEAYLRASTAQPLSARPAYNRSHTTSVANKGALSHRRRSNTEKFDTSSLNTSPRAIYAPILPAAREAADAVLKPKPPPPRKKTSKFSARKDKSKPRPRAKPPEASTLPSDQMPRHRSRVARVMSHVHVHVHVHVARAHP